MRKTDLQLVFEFVDNKYTSDFVKLFKKDISFPYPNENFKDKSDDGIIRYFHKSIWHANKHGKLSPFDAWKDKKMVLKVANNRLKYVGSCKPSDIIYGFNVTCIAPKVSVFSCDVAENLIKKFLSDYEEIFDPFSGFSGRMIGTYRNNKKYIGQDISHIHVSESNEIIKYLDISNTCSVVEKDIFDDNEKSFQCLFTCPPYFNKEKWNEDERFLKCDDWIDLCLKKYKCKTYLFVVDETEKYNKYIVDEITNKSHFGENKEYVIKIDMI